MAIFCNCGSNNWETVIDRRVHAARHFASIAKFTRLAKQSPQGKNEVKMAERNAVQGMDIVATEC